MGPGDAVHHRVSHVEVRRGHVDLRAQRARAVLELPGAHAREEIQVLVDRTLSVGTVASRLVDRAAVLAGLVRGEVAHVREALLDQLHREAVELLEVVAGVERLARPLEAEPADVVLDRVHELLALLRRVRVVEAQVAGAAVARRDPEVHADRLGVADVEVAVRLRGEARQHGGGLALGEIGVDGLLDEVPACGVVGRGAFGVQRGGAHGARRRFWGVIRVAKRSVADRVGAKSTDAEGARGASIPRARRCAPAPEAPGPLSIA